MTTTVATWKMIHDERARSADMLESLSPEQWSADTLCGGWNVHQVAAHMMIAGEQTNGRFLTGLLLSGFRFDVMTDRDARRADVLSSAEIIARIRARTTTTNKPPAPALAPLYAPADSLPETSSPPPSYFATFSFDPVRDAAPRSLSAVPFTDDSPPRVMPAAYERLQAFELGAGPQRSSAPASRQPSDPLPTQAGITEMSLDDDFDGPAVAAAPVPVRGRARAGSLDDLVRGLATMHIAQWIAGTVHRCAADGAPVGAAHPRGRHPGKRRCSQGGGVAECCIELMMYRSHRRGRGNQHRF